MLTRKTVPSGNAFAGPGTKVTMPSSVLSFDESRPRASRTFELGAAGGSGVSTMPASGLLGADCGGDGGGAAAGAGRVTTAGAAGACSEVVMASFAGGVETP